MLRILRFIRRSSYNILYCFIILEVSLAWFVLAVAAGLAMLRGCSRLSSVFRITDIDVRELILNSIALHAATSQLEWCNWTNQCYTWQMNDIIFQDNFNYCSVEVADDVVVVELVVYGLVMIIPCQAPIDTRQSEISSLDISHNTSYHAVSSLGSVLRLRKLL